MELNAKIPAGPIEQKWDKHRFEMKLVNPANKRKYTVIVVGSGLAGASAAATLGELGYNVKCFCFQDSPAPRAQHRRAGRDQRRQELPERRRQHLPAVLRHGEGRRLPRARGQRLPPGPDQRRTSSTSAWRRACRSRASTAGCWPTARSAARRSRAPSTRGARPASSCCSAPIRRWRRQIGAGQGRRCIPRTEMLDLVVIDGRARGHRGARHGDRRDRVATLGDAVVLGTGGYGNVFYLSTNAKGSQRHRDLAGVQARRRVRQPVLHPDPSDLHSGQRRLSVEAHPDERVAPQRRPRLGAASAGRRRAPPDQIPEAERDYYLERRYPSFGNLAPRDIASRAAKEVCDEGRGVGRGGLGVYLDFADAIKRLGAPTIRERYGNLFEMYERITGENPYRMPMRIYPGGALHDGRALGGLQPDEHDPRPVRHRRGQFLRPRRQPAGRERADAGLADGYFILPYTIGDYLAAAKLAQGGRVASGVPPGRSRGERADSDGCWRSTGKRTVDSFHRELGQAHVGQVRHGAERGRPARGARADSRAARGVLAERQRAGQRCELNQALEKAGRVADFLELGELMCRDALHREESCGGHFREEYQTEDGEAQRDDEHFAYVAAWEYTGD